MENKPSGYFTLTAYRKFTHKLLQDKKQADFIFVNSIYFNLSLPNKSINFKFLHLNSKIK